MSKNIVVLGSINYDITASAERLPAKGETVVGFSVDMFGGGKGANQAVQAAQMGVPTAMIGQVGNDMQGSAVLETLKSKGIDCDRIHVSDTNRTGCASIYVDPNGDNMLVYAPGANHKITKEMIDAGKDVIADAAVFITQTEINLDAAMYGLKLAKEAGARRLLPLRVSGPFHTPLMRSAAEALHERFQSEVFGGMQIPVLFNCLGREKSDETIPSLLERQVFSPVRMEDTIRELARLGTDTFVEIGPGAALTGFVRKTLGAAANCYAVENVAGLEKAVEALR